MPRATPTASSTVVRGALEIETTVYETLYHWRRFIQDSYPNPEHEAG